MTANFAFRAEVLYISFRERKTYLSLIFNWGRRTLWNFRSTAELFTNQKNKGHQRKLLCETWYWRWIVQMHVHELLFNSTHKPKIIILWRRDVALATSICARLLHSNDSRITLLIIKQTKICWINSVILSQQVPTPNRHYLLILSIVVWRSSNLIFRQLSHATFSIFWILVLCARRMRDDSKARVRAWWRSMHMPSALTYSSVYVSRFGAHTRKCLHVRQSAMHQVTNNAEFRNISTWMVLFVMCLDADRISASK